MSVRQIMPGALRYSLMPNMLDQSSLLHKPFLLSALFFSGFAALIYEIVWQRILVRFLGGNFSSVSLIVCVFLGGMAIGAMLVSIAQSKNKIKNPGKVWALLEGVLGACGITSMALSWLIASPIADPTLTAAISIFLLLIPTICMGASLPVAIELLSRNGNTKAVLASYALNTTGALGGVICTSFLFLPNFGISTTLFFAAAINLFIGAALFWSRNKIQSNTQTDLKSESSHRLLPFIAFISGWIIMMLEVCWTRYFSLIAGTNTYTFGLVVAFCLGGLSMGAWIISAVNSRRQIQSTNFLQALAVVFTIAALCLMASIFGLSVLPDYFPRLLEQSLASFGQANYFLVKMVLLAICMNLLVLTPCTICGTIFPLVLSLSKQTAKLLAYNTAGCVFGYFSLRVLFEIYNLKIGITTTEMCFLIILAILYLCALILIHHISREKITLISSICLTLAVLSAPVILLRPQWSKEALTSSSPNSLRFFKEGQNAVVSVENVNGLFALKTNGKTEGSLPDPVPSDIQPLMSDMPTQVLLGLLPQALNATKHSSGLVIGMGTGMTCGTAIGLNNVKECTVVEIEKTVLEAAKEFAAYNHTPWDSPKCKIKIADARQFLSNSDEKYDWIISQPGEPSNSGSANLYTSEFFKLTKSKLKHNGTFVQWVQLYGLNEGDLRSLIDAFSIAFEDNGPENRCVAFQPRGAGEIILISRQNPELLVTRLKNIFHSADFKNKLYSIGINTPSDLLADLVGVTKAKKFAFPNTDDNLKVEMNSARNKPANEKQIKELESALRSLLSQPLRELEDQLKYARVAHTMPLYTCASDYYLLSKTEPETLSEVYPQSLNTNLFGSSDSPASITYKAFNDFRNGQAVTDCLTQFEKSLEINPLQYIANYYAGQCHYQLGDLQNALWRMKTASQIYPVSNRPHFFVCAALIRDEQFDLAKQNIAKLSNRKLKTIKEKAWLDGLNKTISSGKEDLCIDQILSP